MGQLNRNISSRSYGSFDRAFWHYRTNDISCARYQEALYTLTLLYCSDFEGNDYFHDTKVLEWIRAALRFTASIQRKNGSFDEWYINEGSYVATAFVTAAVSEALVLLKQHHVQIPEEPLVQQMLEASAQFLMHRTEKTVMNQVSGAVFAVAAVGKISGKQECTQFAEEKMEEFLSLQNKEGWWKEYGGPDIGYLTLTISYLEKYQATVHPTKNAKATVALASAIAKAKNFVVAFIAPDKTAGGEYMSRNTEYIVPSVTLPYVGAVTPAHLDDRYLCYILYNWLQTGLKTAPQMLPSATVTAGVTGETFFDECGILRVSAEHYFLVANAAKGGSFRLYSKSKVYYDSGLEISGNLSTGILDTENKISFQKGGQEKQGNLRVAGATKKIKEPLLKTPIAVGFKLWQLLFGRVSLFQKILKDFLRPRMVSYAGSSGVTFEREIVYGPQSVVITDIVRGVAFGNAILMGTKSAYSAVPSSKYAAIPEIASRQLAPVLEEKHENGTYYIKRTFSFTP